LFIRQVRGEAHTHKPNVKIVQQCVSFGLMIGHRPEFYAETGKLSWRGKIKDQILLGDGRWN
jgi:hypothetical protein